MPSALPHGDPAPPSGRLPESALLGLRGAPFGFYVHIPFCTVRCGYCDFNTYTAAELGNGVSRGSYADTVLAEIRLARDVLPASTPPVSTVFFGGGTPSLLPAEHLGLILDAIRRGIRAGPGRRGDDRGQPGVGRPGLLRQAGRAGLQSDLARHAVGGEPCAHGAGSPASAGTGAGGGRRGPSGQGFEHVNLDLIYGTPGESDLDWQRSLDAAIASGADHVSAYALIVEEGTPLARKVATGAVPAPDDDVLADRYLQADDTLTAAGFGWYEVSNWARTPAARSKHNQLYWSSANWWGAGPGAHSHVGGVRWWNVKHPSALRRPARARLQPGRRTRDARRTSPIDRAADAAAADGRRAGAGRAAGRGDPPRPAVRDLGAGRARCRCPTAGWC